MPFAISKTTINTSETKATYTRMAGLKSPVYLSSKAALLYLVNFLAAQTQKAAAQSCAPFVMPSANSASPSADCCSALQSVDHDCLCNTIRISARLPSQCNLPPLGCANWLTWRINASRNKNNVFWSVMEQWAILPAENVEKVNLVLWNKLIISPRGNL